METQEVERGPARQDRDEERVEELDGLAARHEDDEFVVLRKLNTEQSTGAFLAAGRQTTRLLVPVVPCICPV